MTELMFPLVLGRPWYDALLLLLLILTFSLEAVKIRHRSGMGLSLRSKAAWLATLFAFGLLVLPPPPATVLTTWPGMALTILRAIGYAICLWEVYELAIRGWVVRDD